MHEQFNRQEHVERPTERSFGVVMSVFFALVALFPVSHGANVRTWALAVTALFAAAAFLAPKILRPLNIAWAKLGELLFVVVSPIAMGVLFFLAVTPMGLISRLFGHDLLKIKRDPAAKSYWISRDPPGPSPESMTQQF